MCLFSNACPYTHDLAIFYNVAVKNILENYKNKIKINSNKILMHISPEIAVTHFV